MNSSICAALLLFQTSDRLPQVTPRQLLANVVSMLNANDRATTRTFVNRWFVANSPIDARVDRWMALSNQGHPFAIVSDGPQTGTEVDAVVVDKAGVRLAFKMHYQFEPTLKIVGLQLAPAYTLEGTTPGFNQWKTLHELAVSLMGKNHSPAMGIAVVHNGVADISVAGYRTIKSKSAVEPNDPWSIGSIGKPICSTVVGKLIEEGRLRWDETLKQALPGIPMSSGYKSVTLEQVMQHRAGMPQDMGFSNSEVKSIIGPAKTAEQIRDRYVRDILGRVQIARAGERFIYSNAGYALLAHVAELAAGIPYEALVKKLVFQPLGLTHSYANGDKLPAARPIGHAESPNGLQPMDLSGPMEEMFAGAGGGFYMSVGDLAKFGQAHLAGLNGQDGILKSATVQRLHKGLPEQEGGVRLYGCGWSMETVPGLQAFQGHNGSNGAMRAELAIFPASDLVVVGVANRGGEDEPSPGMQAVLAIGQRYAARR